MNDPREKKKQQRTREAADAAIIVWAPSSDGIFLWFL